MLQVNKLNTYLSSYSYSVYLNYISGNYIKMQEQNLNVIMPFILNCENIKNMCLIISIL